MPSPKDNLRPTLAYAYRPYVGLAGSGGRRIGGARKLSLVAIDGPPFGGGPLLSIFEEELGDRCQPMHRRLERFQPLHIR